MFKGKMDDKGQSAVEFLILLPVLVFVVLVSYQIFSIVYTSLVNQGAARFMLFHKMENMRGFATKPPIPGIQDPVYPELEVFSPRYRSSQNKGNISGRGAPPTPYYAMMVEEPRGSGLFPKRRIRTIGEKVIQVRTKVGICERNVGICK